MRQNAVDRPTVIFVHVPKTGGSTLGGILRRQYRPEEIYEITAGKELDSIRHFIDLPEDERCRFRAILGHMPIGIHEFLPRPHAYVTFLRDPVDRVVSAYYFIRGAKHHPKHKALRDNNMTLRDYVCSRLSAPVHNNMVFRLCSANVLRENIWTEKLSRTPDRLEAAKQNLGSFFLVGITEYFDAGIEILARSLGWQNVAIHPENVSRGRPRLNEIDEEVIALIRKKNADDLRLYEYAKGLFLERVRREPGIDLDVRVKTPPRVYRVLRTTYNAMTGWRHTS